MEEPASYPPDLAELLAELRGLRESAPTERLAAMLPRLKRMVRQHLPHRSPLRLGLDSEDLMQEGLVHLVRQVDAFRGSSWGEFLAFAQAILAQKTAQQARRQQLRRGELAAGQDAADLEALGPSPSTDVAQAEDKRRVQVLVRTLPSAYRQPIEMRLSGHDNESIARELGITNEALRQRMSRAIRMLQQRW